MACNPYAGFGFGDTSLPPCPGSLDFRVGDPVGRKPLDPLTLGLCEGTQAEIDQAVAGIGDYLTRAGATDPRVPKTTANTDYYTFLFARRDALLACRPTARSGTIAPMSAVQYSPTELAFFREQQRRIDAGIPIITAAQLAPLTAIRPAEGPVVGASMSSMSSWFGLAPSTVGTSFPTSFSAGNFSDALFGALPGLANTAAQFFLLQQQQKAMEDAAKARLRELQALAALQQGAGGLNLTQQGTVIVGPDGTLTMGGGMGMPCVPGVDPGCIGPSWMIPGGGGLLPSGRACGQNSAVSVSPADAPGIYRQGCGGSVSTRSRFFALRSDGTRDLFVKVGKVQSVSPRTLNRFARRWAKEAGLTASKRGAGAKRGRRRPR